MQSATCEIFRSEELLVRANLGFDSECCVVTFDSFTDHRTLDRSGFGEAFFHSIRVDAIHVLSRENNWYQHPEFMEALDQVRNAAKTYRRRVVYGSSMGAYAAVRYGRLVGGDIAVAFSPQYSINPELVPFENRWLSELARIDFVHENTATDSFSPLSYVFYDPADMDAKHARLLGLKARLVTIPVRNTGHPSIGVIADMGLLKPILEQVLHGSLDLNWFYKEFRQRRGRSPTYLRQLSLRGKCQRRRLAILQRAIELAPTVADLRSHLGLLLSETGDFEGAEDAFRLAIDTEPRNPVHLYRRSIHLERSGRVDEAILVIEHLIAIFGPASAYVARLDYLRSLEVQVLPKSGRTDERPSFWRGMLARLLAGRPGQDKTR